MAGGGGSSFRGYSEVTAKRQRRSIFKKRAIFCSCDVSIRDKYCAAPYGGDLHTACRFCGVGPQCPTGSSGSPVEPSGRGIKDPEVKREILRRHNEYRDRVRNMTDGAMAGRARCIPRLR